MTESDPHIGLDDVPPIATIAEMTEDDLALAFSRTHAQELRYVAPWAKWLRWDGQVWIRDETLSVYDSIRNLVRSFGDAIDPKARAKLLRAQTVSAVHTLTKADRRHAATIKQWDADDWVLNTPSGIVDLRTGKLRPHDSAEHCTKITASSPANDDSPRWQQFLGEVTDGDASLISYLQRLAGYAATGSVAEHMLAFFLGTGRNGKGVFLNTLQGVLADYATVAGTDVFTETRGERHPTELAALQAARLVVAQETDEGRHWNEARIKALTGGDPITARFMRQDFFTYEPKFTLVIAGNHKPQLRNVDEAMVARLHLVPFTVTIPKHKRDPNLAEKLKAEYAGIMQWIIDGCMDYQRIGLSPPPIVTEATADYFEDENMFNQWVSDCCECGTHFWEPTGSLFKSWRDYTTATNEPTGTQKSFAQKLELAGFKKGRTGVRGRHWVGLRVKESALAVGSGSDAGDAFYSSSVGSIRGRG